MAHKDLINQDLHIGDPVVMRMPSYSDICIGTVIGLTPKKVRVEYTNTWNYSKGQKENILVSSMSLFKIDKANPAFVEFLMKNSG